jgi:hypothetical protein
MDKQNRSSYFRCILAVLALVVLSATAWAQFEKGSISGTVTDSTGAVINQAQVTLTSAQTGAVRTATTDDRGAYTITALAPGAYDLQIAQKGFGTSKQRVTVSLSMPERQEKPSRLSPSKERRSKPRVRPPTRSWIPSVSPNCQP